MIKVLIADDEEVVHDQLRSMIPWDELGWEIVAHAYNGEEALTYTLEHRPHLILTDIKMPVMDGLSFMKWLSESDLSAKVIVLSGYGDFNFSRSAFLLGAYDYLLKPIRQAELLMTLSKAVDQIQADSRSQADRIRDKAVLNQGITLMRDEFITNTLMNSSTFEENEWIVQAGELYIPIPESHYAVAVVQFPDLDEPVNERFQGDWNLFYFAVRNIVCESIGKDIPVFRNLHKTNEFVILFSSNFHAPSVLASALSRTRESLAVYLRVQCIVGTSTWKQRLGKLPAAYAEALNSLESIRLSWNSPIAVYGETRTVTGRPAASWDELALLLDTLLDTGDGDRLAAKLNEALSSQLPELTVADWRKVMTRLLDQFERGTDMEEVLFLLRDARTGVQELRVKQVNDLLRKMTEMLSAASDPRGKQGKQLIDAVKKYIDANFQTVSLEEIAQRFYLNKNYFCSLFKGVTGVSFMEYLIARRMEHAKRFLAETEMRMNEIAERVGYADQRYFSQVFRKYSGMQPSQFRQQARQGFRR
jgi:two-component system response regulator YesN